MKEKLVEREHKIERIGSMFTSQGELKLITEEEIDNLPGYSIPIQGCLHIRPIFKDRIMVNEMHQWPLCHTREGSYKPKYSRSIWWILIRGGSVKTWRLPWSEELAEQCLDLTEFKLTDEDAEELVLDDFDNKQITVFA